MLMTIWGVYALIKFTFTRTAELSLANGIDVKKFRGAFLVVVLGIVLASFGAICIQGPLIQLDNGVLSFEGLFKTSTIIGVFIAFHHCSSGIYARNKIGTAHGEEKMDSAQ